MKSSIGGIRYLLVYELNGALLLLCYYYADVMWLGKRAGGCGLLSGLGQEAVLTLPSYTPLQSWLHASMIFE